MAKRLGKSRPRGKAAAARGKTTAKRGTPAMRSSVIGFRATAGHEAELKVWAAERGVTVSDLVRNVLVDQLEARRALIRLADDAASAATSSTAKAQAA